MITRSTAIAAMAVFLSFLLHVLGLNIVWPNQLERPVEEDVTEAVALGNAFENVADAISEPVKPSPAPLRVPRAEPAVVPEPPVEAPAPPEQAEAPTSEVHVASADPQRVFAPDTGSAKIVQPETTGSADLTESGVPEPETVKPSGGDEGTVADTSIIPAVQPDELNQAPLGDQPSGTESEEPVVTAPVAAPSVAPSPQPVTPQQLAALPSPAVPVRPVTPSRVPEAVPVIPLESETVAPETPVPTDEPTPKTLQSPADSDASGESELAVIASLRPRLPDRRPQVGRTGLQDGTSDPSKVTIRPTELIESPLLAYRRGQRGLTFRPLGGAQSGGSGQRDSRGPGNSDVTNYAGRVLVHLNRAPVVYVSARGFARVLFEIAPDGSVAWVDIVDSSGSREIDNAAKAQVRNAAPFPRPPQGVSRKLAFYYQIN